MQKLPTPPEEAIIYDDKNVYVCLASHAITRGHTVVVWKHEAKDISILSCDEYAYLMNVVDITRDVLRHALGIEKVYLVYMDEIQQVHWHLIPRYDEQGFNMLNHTPVDVEDFSLAGNLKKMFEDEVKKHSELS